jgi:5-methylcytosine-specific restriction endonuclease McrA
MLRKLPRDRYCFYCGRKLTRRCASKDHVLPRSKGGSNSKHNIVDSCKECNEAKGSLLMEEFRAVMAFREGVNLKKFKFPGEIV